MLRTEKGNPRSFFFLHTHTTPAKDGDEDDDSISFCVSSCDRFSLSYLSSSIACDYVTSNYFSLPTPPIVTYSYFPRSRPCGFVLSTFVPCELSSFSFGFAMIHNPLTDAGIECNYNKLLSLPRHQSASFFSLLSLYYI